MNTFTNAMDNMGAATSTPAWSYGLVPMLCMTAGNGEGRPIVLVLDFTKRHATAMRVVILYMLWSD